MRCYSQTTQLPLNVRVEITILLGQVFPGASHLVFQDRKQIVKKEGNLIIRNRI